MLVTLAAILASVAFNVFDNAHMWSKYIIDVNVSIIPCITSCLSMMQVRVRMRGMIQAIIHTSCSCL